MAQFPNLNRELSFRGKTHTGLVVSEGAAPAEELIISRTNSVTPWTYEYGPEGNQSVVLAKGKVVEVVGAEYDADTGFNKTGVKQSTDAAQKVLGVNFHNVYARRRDGMHSHLTRPVVITRNYVELPLFEVDGAGTLADAQILANAMKFGAAVSASGLTATNLSHGDYVVSDAYGNVRKYVKGTDAPEAVFGQVWAKETELPPAGFLQYYTDLVNPEMEEYLKLISRNPSPGLPADGSAAAFPYGAPYTNKGWKPEFEKLLMGAKMAGIPFLTDGFFRAQENIDVPVSAGTAGAMVLDANIEAVRVGEGATWDVTNNRVTVNANTRTGVVFFKLKHPIDQTKLANVSVKINGVAVNSNDLIVDILNNTLVVYLAENNTASPVQHNTFRVFVPSVVDPVAGIPTGWDFKGSTGAVRILLQK